MKKKLHTYLVRLSPHSSYKVRAFSIKGARQQVWRDIGSGYRYGWTKSDFMKRVPVERTD